MDEGRGLVAAQFDPASGRVLAQETLFNIPAGYRGTGSDFYDVSLDGERFLMARLHTDDTEDAAPPSYILIQNFFEELKRLVPTN